MDISKLLHLFAVIIWVGGMFFAYVVLRPSAVEVLQPPERLRLWDKVFSRFFKWVWLAVFLLLASGLYMIHLFGGMAGAPSYVHAMLTLGTVMMLIYAYVYFVAYARLSKLVAAQDWPSAGAVLASIRKLVAVNLALGLLTVAVVMLGRGM
ncbi:MAG: CopD family protein [Nitrosomonadales bacterium]|nr:CopD family protein [Nitrosomonadales bacterium]